LQTNERDAPTAIAVPSNTTRTATSSAPANIDEPRVMFIACLYQPSPSASASSTSFATAASSQSTLSFARSPVKSPHAMAAAQSVASTALSSSAVVTPHVNTISASGERPSNEAAPRFTVLTTAAAPNIAWYVDWIGHDCAL
jgi:hypothetical protein